jgi:carbon monoxide dehydrogenase subunit G
MVPVKEELLIAAPLASVWPLLGDPAVVASCIPGAELAPDKGDGVWRGSVRVKFGPTVAVFRGETNLSFDEEAKRCTIEARGIDQRGASRALASFVITASGAQATTLMIDGGISVTGPLGTFANAGGIHVVRGLLGEFSINMARLADQQAAPSLEDTAVRPAAAPAPPSPPTAELRVGRLLWLSLVSWIGKLFGKRKT